eukprot:TRINITY_DN5615_c0_g3_i2.p2 TRINITY_DN5615_c0_g3~~TRINITY_DN5615_c0_g3_i2.p2  ORF type:complete len:109 (-),score=4.39 TRINITY_DN5615_c0_g3_i2:89-415(-)
MCKFLTIPLTFQIFVSKTKNTEKLKNNNKKSQNIPNTTTEKCKKYQTRQQKNVKIQHTLFQTNNNFSDRLNEIFIRKLFFSQDFLKGVGSIVKNIHQPYNCYQGRNFF